MINFVEVVWKVAKVASEVKVSYITFNQEFFARGLVNVDYLMHGHWINLPRKSHLVGCHWDERIAGWLKCNLLVIKWRFPDLLMGTGWNWQETDIWYIDKMWKNGHKFHVLIEEHRWFLSIAMFLHLLNLSFILSIRLFISLSAT